MRLRIRNDRPTKLQSSGGPHGALAVALHALALATWCASARADDQPAASAAHYSPYEQASIDEITAKLGTEVDAAAEGKTIEAIDVAPIDVIEKRDPAPSFLNYFHATTRKHVLAREALLRPGQPYRAALCDETARNLRQLQQLSLVVCVATRGSQADQVRVLIITKDVWSLRLGWELSYVGGGLESLTVVPTETNRGGSHQVVYGRYAYLPLSQSFALGYRIPRLAGLRLSLGAEAGVTWNKRGQLEGSAGTLVVTSPQYSAQTAWAWAVGTTWADAVVRVYSNAQQARYPALPAPGQATIPWEYHSRKFAEAAYLTRSFGWALKNDFTVGVEMNLRQYRAPDVEANALATRDAFVAARMPRGDTRVGPFAQYRGYTSEYLRVLDFETLGLQEDFRLGHDLVLRVYPVSAALGASRTFLGVYAAAQYTVALGDGLLRAGVESTTEAQRDTLADGEISAELRLVTPRVGLGRLVFDAVGLHRYQNFLNRTSYLGGESRLRGYPSNYFFGKDSVAYNLELRTVPIEVLAVQIGGAAFFDVGHAADGVSVLRPRQSTGFGLRMLFPQLNRIVFRADIGFPLARELDRGVSPWSVALAFEQAFTMPGVGGRYATTGGAPVGWLGQ